MELDLNNLAAPTAGNTAVFRCEDTIRALDRMIPEFLHVLDVGNRALLVLRTKRGLDEDFRQMWIKHFEERMRRFTYLVKTHRMKRGYQRAKLMHLQWPGG